jgi:cytochrome oxidase Cu insertion factor (SCO1/SenC/PrrC family)
MSKGWKKEQERRQKQRRRRRLMMRWGIAAAVFLGVVGGGYAYWRANTIASPGGVAPAFTLTDDGGQRVALEDFRGKKAVVLFFYMVNT